MLLTIVGGILAFGLSIYAAASRYSCGCYYGSDLSFTLFLSIGIVGGMTAAVFGVYHWFWGLTAEARETRFQLKRSIATLSAAADSQTNRESA